MGFVPIKTSEQFRNAYEMHDLAIDNTAHQYLKNGFYLYPLGVDLRTNSVMIENELPDYVVEKGSNLFCFDAKAKSSTKYFGWVNERAGMSYRRFAEKCSVSVYLIFVQIIANRVMTKIGYSNVMDNIISTERAWDGNVIWVFRWNEGIPII